MAKTTDIEKAPTFKDVDDLRSQLTAQWSATGGALLNICRFAARGVAQFPKTFPTIEKTEEWVIATRAKSDAPSKQSAYKIRQFIRMAFAWDRKGSDVVATLVAASVGEPDRYNRIITALGTLKAANFKAPPDASVIEKHFADAPSSKGDGNSKAKPKPKVIGDATLAAGWALLRDWHIACGTETVKGKVQPKHQALTDAIAVIQPFAVQAATNVAAAKKAAADKKRKNKPNAKAIERQKELAAQKEGADLIKALASTPVSGQPN